VRETGFADAIFRRRLVKPVPVLAGVALLSVLASVCCRRAATPNILLITLDTTRADRIGAYGYRAAETPAIDRLAADGILFERAVSAAPITLPAHVSLLTGLYPFRHGVRNNGNFVLDKNIPTLATLLRDGGYRTAAFVSAFVLDRRYGLARGFDQYDDRFELERRGGDTGAAVDAWLAANGRADRPFFAWVHFYDPHDPYDPPAPFRGAFAGRPYDGEIAYDDQVVGTIVARLKSLDLDSSTIVAVVGDHGESLGDHDEATHAMFVYESAVRVPMILRAPGFAAGRRVPELVRTIDLAPTLLSLAGRPPLATAQGQSLVPLIRGARTQVPDAAYAETYFPRLFMNWSALRSIQDARWKYIDAPVAELYDLTNDPGERINLAAREPGRVAAMKRAFDTMTGGEEGAVAPVAIDRDTARKLAALGYIGAAVDRSGASEAARPDPKAMIGVFNRLREANAAIQQRRYAEAESSARSVLQQDATNAFAMMIVARAEMEQGRYREAAKDYRQYAELVPSSADAHQWIAVCLSRLGDVDGAMREVDISLGLDPRHAEARALRGGLLARRGHLDDAVGELRTAVDIAPDNVPFRIGLARLLIDRQRLDEAEAEIRHALDREPGNPDALAARASVLAGRGQLDAARAEFERALAAQPDADDVRLDFAGVLERLGRSADARREYTRLADGRWTPEDIRRAARERLR
jgi:choline-sulfatase